MKAEGFNLVELCISMLIIAVLSSGFYYSYHRYQYGLARKNATLILEDMALTLERYKDPVRGYQQLSLGGLGFSAQDAYYTYSLQGTKNTYLVRAAPLVQDACGVLGLNEQGLRTSVGNTLSCW